ncbi:matrixin family metalloprotease [Arcticibacter tournemirensis]|uniref:Matrixin family metalloprotease n=1 Tax=Arcticibacter tournemirensis TaxID=699437 RepID=A0A4Q0MAA7_9SPHI|nr:matrixin family metalloprotease [Arcticibacter tournemirensis]RXF69716.1 matrixin family metalloprotease [Arcticibacter tournemirensis]
MKNNLFKFPCLAIIVLLYFGCNKNPEIIEGSTENSVRLNSLGNTNLALDSTVVYYDDWPTTRTTNKRSNLGGQREVSPNYVPIGTVWEGPVITYFLKNETNDIIGEAEYQAIGEAFQLWTQVTGLVFLEVCNQNEANIAISWETFAHGDPNPPCINGGCDFDGIGGVLAHTLGGPPPNSFGDFAGDIHFDDSEIWVLNTRDNNTQPIDLMTVAAHEIGHLLGLDHTSVNGSLMEAIYTGSHRFLGSDDIAGIQSLYGSNASSNMISGASFFCTSSTYTLNNLPAGTTVAWSVSPSSEVSITTNGTSCLLNRTGTSSVSITLTAVITSTCGTSVQITKTINSGVPDRGLISVYSSSSSIPRGAYIPFNALYASSNCNYSNAQWSISPSTYSIQYNTGFPCPNDNNGGVSIAFHSPGIYYIRVRLSNNCGWSEISNPKAVNVY